MDVRDTRYLPINEASRIVGFIFAALGIIYGDICIAPSLGLFGLFVEDGALDSSNRVRGLDDRSCILVGEAA